MVFLDTTDDGNGIDGFSAHGTVGGIDTSNFHHLESIVGEFRENDCDPVTAIKLGDAASAELAAAAANGQMFSRFNVYFFAIDPVSGVTELSRIWGLQNPVISTARVTTKGEGAAATVVDTLTIVPQVISVINDGSVVLAMVECSKKDR